MSALFSTFQLKDVSLRRIAVASMCQYQAQDGIVNDWHFTHYSSLGRGGSGLVIVEATAVSPEGRITPGCTGLWKMSRPKAWRKSRLIKAAGAVPGIQIGQATRQVPIFLGRRRSYPNRRSAWMGDHCTIFHCLWRRPFEGA